jgi:hypothetical protein
VETFATEIDPENQTALAQASRDPDIWLLQIDRGTPQAFLPELIDNSVLNALRAELCISNVCATSGKVDQQRAVGAEMRRPIDTPCSLIQLVARACRRGTQLEDDAIRHAAPKAGPIPQSYSALEGHTDGPLDDLLSPQTLKFLSQIDPDTRGTGREK